MNIDPEVMEEADDTVRSSLGFYIYHKDLLNLQDELTQRIAQALQKKADEIKALRIDVKDADICADISISEMEKKIKEQAAEIESLRKGNGGRSGVPTLREKKQTALLKELGAALEMSKESLQHYGYDTVNEDTALSHYQAWLKEREGGL